MWIITVSEIMFGLWNYRASKGREYRTGMVWANSEEAAISKASAEVSA